MDEFDFDLEELPSTGENIPSSGEISPKRGRGRPKGSLDQIKRLPKGSIKPAEAYDGILPASVVNGNFFTTGSMAAGGNILFVWNTDVSSHNFTITSQPDAHGRSGDIATYAIGAGVISAFKLSQIAGWADNSGRVFVTADNALVKFAVVQM